MCISKVAGDPKVAVLKSQDDDQDWNIERHEREQREFAALDAEIGRLQDEDTASGPTHRNWVPTEPRPVWPPRDQDVGEGGGAALMVARQRLRDDVAKLAAVIVDLLDRSVVSGYRERDRLGTLPALRRGVELDEKMREADGQAHDCAACRGSARERAAAEVERSWEREEA